MAVATDPEEFGASLGFLRTPTRRPRSRWWTLGGTFAPATGSLIAAADRRGATESALFLAPVPRRSRSTLWARCPRSVFSTPDIIGRSSTSLLESIPGISTRYRARDARTWRAPAFFNRSPRHRSSVSWMVRREGPFRRARRAYGPSSVFQSSLHLVTSAGTIATVRMAASAPQRRGDRWRRAAAPAFFSPINIGDRTPSPGEVI